MALPLRPRRPLTKSLQCLNSQFRNFSQTQSLSNLKSKDALLKAHDSLPEYPYGASLWYKKSNRGLYGGLKVRSGNNVSEKTETKTRRKWHPNIQNASLYSHALDEYIKIKVATRVLRTVDKCGGLDEYLVGEKPARIRELGMKGWLLRCKIMETPWWRERQARERDALGLSPVRKYVPDKFEDEEGDFLVGMFGEKLKIEAPEEGEAESPREIEEQEEEAKTISVIQTGEKLKIPKPMPFKYASQKAKRKFALKQIKLANAKRTRDIMHKSGKQVPVKSTDLQTFVHLEAEKLRKAKEEEKRIVRERMAEEELNEKKSEKVRKTERAGF